MSVAGPATEIGGEPASNPTVRKLTFTGSTEVGKLLIQQCSAWARSFRLNWAAAAQRKRTPSLSPL
jgi:acyl-CoA reductase-like NAD-dependent aldehyde dehydrogenase